MKNKIELHKSRMEKVKAGQKTATLRDGSKSYDLGQGVLVNPLNEKDTINISITDVKVLKMNELTPQMIKEEGYVSYADLKKTMVDIYPHLNDESTVTHVVFSVV